MMTEQTLRKAGAEATQEGVTYTVWAPDCQTMDVVLFQNGNPERTIPMSPAGDGYFEAVDAQGAPGDLYKYRLDGDESRTFPDVASRYQPEGVHGPSQVCASGTYTWRNDRHWRTHVLSDLVIYELHIGTFTPAGTYLAAIEKLDYLVSIGVNALEIMPLSDWPGRWNWGYDGVMPYAPSRAYGTPDDLRALVDAAHGKGLSVIIDAVYNHFGPDGAYFGAYTKSYFNPAHKTPWGDALNFDGPHHGPVREFFLNNAIYWMEEFHFDGFRLDATHAIVDDSERHILSEISAAVHERGGFLFAEDERNDARLATPEADGGIGLDGMWADDFHHIVRVMLTGEQESYFENFAGSAGELTDTLEHGWFYRGQLTRRGGKERGTECIQLPTSAFCCCISNHDQVGNRAFGERLDESCTPAAYRAASALLCLSPYTPLIFQGQEWMASTPFLFFTDHNEELGRLITEGRRKEFAGFKAFAESHVTEQIPDPQHETTFQRSKLNWAETEAGAEMHHAGTLALYKEALRLRREEPALRCRARGDWEVRALDEEVVALVYSCGDTSEVCLVIFGLRGCSSTSVGPITTSTTDGGHLTHFRTLFSSNDARFGGDGAVEFDVGKQMVTFREPGLLVLKATAAA